MKNLLLTTIAAVVLVGCGPSEEVKRLDFINNIGMGNVERVKQAIADGAELNTNDGKWKNPLHMAAQHDQKEIVELLIANGADVNFTDGKGRTPLNLAGWETADLRGSQVQDVIQPVTDPSRPWQRKTNMLGGTEGGATGVVVLDNNTSIGGGRPIVAG